MGSESRHSIHLIEEMIDSIPILNCISTRFLFLTHFPQTVFSCWWADSGFPLFYTFIWFDSNAVIGFIFFNQLFDFYSLKNVLRYSSWNQNLFFFTQIFCSQNLLNFFLSLFLSISISISLFHSLFANRS